jgi:hypothetical protein
VFDEGFLQWMQSRAERSRRRSRSVHFVVHAFGKAFDRNNTFSLGARSRIDARDHGLAIDQNCAGAAFRLFAADLGTRQVQSLAQEGSQSLAWLRFESMVNTVNCKRDLIAHKYPL